MIENQSETVVFVGIDSKMLLILTEITSDMK